MVDTGIDFCKLSLRVLDPDYRCGGPQLVQDIPEPQSVHHDSVACGICHPLDELIEALAVLTQNNNRLTALQAARQLPQIIRILLDLSVNRVLRPIFQRR